MSDTRQYAVWLDPRSRIGMLTRLARLEKISRYREFYFSSSGIWRCWPAWHFYDHLTAVDGRYGSIREDTCWQPAWVESIDSVTWVGWLDGSCHSGWGEGRWATSGNVRGVVGLAMESYIDSCVYRTPWPGRRGINKQRVRMLNLLLINTASVTL